MPQPLFIAIATQVITDLDRKLINGVVGYGARHGGLQFGDLRFLEDEQVPHLLSQGEYDGAIINMTQSAFEPLAEKFPDIPMVNIGTDQLSKKIPSVCGTRGQGSQVLISHLRQQGYQRYAFLDITPEDAYNMRTVNLRRLLAPGEGPLHFYQLPGFDIDEIDPAEIKKLTRWLKELTREEKRTGIIAYDGYRAAAAVEACRELDIAIPDQVGIATYVETRTCLSTVPAITSLETPAYELGYSAAQVLHGMLRGEKPPSQLVEIEGTTVIVRNSTAEPDVFRDEIEFATDFMQKNFTNHVTVDDCLAHLGTVSRASFYRSFCKQVGVPPGEYLRGLKIKHAKELLISTPFSMTRVAELAGFTSLSQFDSAFKRIVGRTPRQFRQGKTRRKRRVNRA